MGNFTSTSPRAIRLRLLPVLMLALSGAAAFAARSPEPECRPEPPDPEMALIFGVAADGTDLRFSIDWENDPALPETVDVELRDRNGNLVAQQAATPRADDVTTEILPSALAGFIAHGLEYRIELGAGVAQPHPFRVSLDCPLGQDCVFEIDSNVSAQAIVVDPALASVLEALAAAGSPDLLGEALALNPHLTGQIASLALQLRELDSEVGIPVGDCSCMWMIQLIRTPEIELRDQPDDDVIETRGTLGMGASHQRVAQAERGGIHTTTNGTTVLKSYLDCSSLAHWIPDAIVVELKESSENVDQPVLKACTDTCSGAVLHELYFEGHTTAVASDDNLDPFGMPARTGLARATETVDFRIDGQSILEAPIESSASAGPGGLLTDTNRVCKADRRFAPAPSASRLTATAVVETDAGRDGVERCSLAEVNNGYLMVATGHAECALKPTAVSSVADDLRRDFFPGYAAQAGGGSQQTVRFNTKSGITKEPWCP